LPPTPSNREKELLNSQILDVIDQLQSPAKKIISALQFRRGNVWSLLNKI
jgi:hypothetical protein